jgi:hypothetical protein
MEVKICPKTMTCPIFSGVLKGTEYVDVYKKLYCEAGEEGRNKCKRFQVSSIAGKCPPNLLPNSSKSVDDIIADMKKTELL